MSDYCNRCGQDSAKCVCGPIMSPRQFKRFNSLSKALDMLLGAHTRPPLAPPMNDPYMHDANATNEDPTPGGPITRPMRNLRHQDPAPTPEQLDRLAAVAKSGKQQHAHWLENCIRTVGGRDVNLLEPDPETLHIEDIAHALAHMPRFGGHLPVFYSVAEHSTATRFWVPEKHMFSALMHDASEAYLVDIPRPLKMLIPQYAAIERRFMEVLSRKFGFAYPLHPEVKKADEKMLHREWDRLMLLKEGAPGAAEVLRGDAVEGV